MADRILLEGLTFYGFHGVDPAEKELGQRFVLDLAVELDLAPAAAADDLRLTVNYAEIYRAVKAVVEGPPRNLLETVAEEVADTCLARFPISRVRVCLAKPGAPIKGSTLGRVAVEIERTAASPRRLSGNPSPE